MNRIRLKREDAIAPVVLSCAVAAGWAAATGYAFVWALPITLFLLIALTSNAWVPYIALLLAVSSAVWAYAYPQVSVASRGVYGSEIILVLCLVSIVVRTQRRDYAPLHRSTGTSMALGLFLVASVLGVFVAVANGTSMTLALATVRPMAFYSAFWVALEALTTPRLRRKVVATVAVLACAIVALQIAQAIVGADHTLFVLGSDLALVAPDPAAAGFLRVRPPGLTLVYIVAAFAAAYLVWGPRTKRLLVAGVLGTCVVGVLLSLNRNMVIGLIVGLAAAGLVARQRSRLVTGIVVSGLVVVCVVAAMSSGGSTINGNPVVERVLSMTDVSALEGGTLEVRGYENRLARRELGRAWLEGIGWGTSYGATLPVIEGGSYVIIDRPWVHNQYYSMWLRTGVFGLIAFLVALGLALWHAGRRLRRPQGGNEAWMAAGAVAAMVAMMASAIVGMYFSEPASIVPLAGVMGLAIALDVSPTVNDRG